MCVRLVLLFCVVGVVVASRKNRQAGYGYKGPIDNTPYLEQFVQPQNNIQQYSTPIQQLSAILPAQPHNTQYQYDVNFATNANAYQQATPVHQTAAQTHEANPNYATTQYDHSRGSQLINAQPLSQQENFYQITAPAINLRQYIPAAINTFSNAAYTAQSDPHTFSAAILNNLHQQNYAHEPQLPQTPSRQPHALPSVNPAADSIVIEAPLTPSNVPSIIEQAPPRPQQPVESTVDVRKDIYLHVPPPEFEEPDVIPSVVSPPSINKKHYKILFIKAPSFKQRPIAIPSVQQNEEKTLVYVLVKKPEASASVVQKIAETKTDKPEVYFIKYGSQREAVATTTSTPLSYPSISETHTEHSHIKQSPQSELNTPLDVTGLDTTRLQLDVKQSNDHQIIPNNRYIPIAAPQ